MSKRLASIYIPTLYFAEGLPYTIVTIMSVVFFKSLGASNEFIGLTTALSLPWSFKCFWAPLVDIYGTKRKWILTAQLLLAALTALMALSVMLPQIVTITLVMFSFIALASATHDIAIDGYYLDVLDTKEQAFYVGVRNAAYKVAWLLGSGGLVFLAGRIGDDYGIKIGWAFAFGICSMLFLAAVIFHMWYLPYPKLPEKSRKQVDSYKFLAAFKTYFDQPNISAIVFYILSFRLGDAFMLKMAQPYLLDTPIQGGAGLSIAEVGMLYGTVGMIFLLLGGLLGGWLVSKFGLKKTLWPTAIIQNSAILLYYFLAVSKPTIGMVAVVNSMEQFAYGLGVAAYTVFLLSTVKLEFKAAHYAMATALMAVGLLLPGIISGYLQQALGYQQFFLLSFASSIPGIIAIGFLKIPDTQQVYT